jgi:integrase
LRRGEALALLVTDVDFTDSTIRVNKTIQLITGKGLVVGEAKSEASARVVAMPSFVEVALWNHLQSRLVDSPYLFATSKGTPFIPRNIVRHFKATLKKAGLPTETRIHDLRHFFVSWLLSKGTPPKDVQVIVGHADFSTTMGVYGHMMAGADREAAKRMDDLFVGQ